MMTMDINSYEKLVNRILSGDFSAEDVSNFFRNTPILPILAKTNLMKNKSVVDIIVTDNNGVPVSGASVLLNGMSKTTGAAGKVSFEFPTDVPPGLILIKKGTMISKVPFTGSSVGQKTVITAILCNSAESPVAIGSSLKDVINTYYQWQLIQNVEKGVFRPELKDMPQMGVLKKIGDYEYEVYVPVPVKIKIPQINLVPANQPVTIPSQPPPVKPVTPPAPIAPPKPPAPPTPQYAKVNIAIIPKESVELSGQEFTIALDAITKNGGFGMYTFSKIIPGAHLISVRKGNALLFATPINLAPGEEKTITVKVAPPQPPAPAPPHYPVQPPKPPAPTPPHYPVTPPKPPTPTPPHYPVTPPISTPQPPHQPVIKYGSIVVDVVAVPSGAPIHRPMPIYPRGGIGVLSLSTPEVEVVVDGVHKSGTIGKYTFSNLRPGEHHVEIYVNSKKIYSGTVNVEAGKTATVSTTYTPPTTGTLVVNVHESGSSSSGSSSGGSPSHGGFHPPAGGVRGGMPPVGRLSVIGGISALSLGVEVVVDGIHKTGGIGRYTFHNLPSGTHTVKVYYNGRLVKSESVTVPENQTKTIVVPVNTGGGIPATNPRAPVGIPRQYPTHPLEVR